MGTSARPTIPNVPIPRYIPPGPVPVTGKAPGSINWPAVFGGVQAIGGIVGTERTNRANRDQAREQMAFQERLANTSAQRGRADYESAGLNPALAYDKGASAPSGASATFGNSLGGLGDAISNGLKAREQRQLLDAQLKSIQTNTAVAAIDGQSKMIEQDQRVEDVMGKRLGNQRSAMVNQQLSMMQPQELRRIIAGNALLEAARPGAENQADAERMLGKYGKLLPMVSGNVRAIKDMINFQPPGIP